MNLIYYVILGLVAGVASGLIGIGGGIIMIPALALIFKLSQKSAQGTTLAVMVPPIGLWAAWTYYKSGYVDLKMTGLICAGFFVGGYIGARFAIGLPNSTLQKVFGAMLLAAGIRMIFFK